MALVPPFFAYLEALRELQGEPMVTYAEGNQAFPVTERVAKVFRTVAKEYRMLDPEPDAVRFPGLVCTEIKELRGERNSVEVYRKWEGLPGPLISDVITDSSSGTTGHEFRQRVSSNTPPYPVGAFRILSIVGGVVTTEYEHNFPATITVYLAGVFGGVVDGYYLATRTGEFTFTIPGGGNAQDLTGWASTAYEVAAGDYEIIVSSKMTDDNDVAGTLVTTTAKLPGMRTHALVWDAGGLRKWRSERTVIPGTQLEARDLVSGGPLEVGDNYQEESITPTSTAQSRHVIEVLVDAEGIPLGKNLGEYTIAVRDGKTRFTSFVTWRIVPVDFQLYVEGQNISTAAGDGLVLECKTSAIRGSPRLLLEVEWYQDLPMTRVEFPATSYSFPGVLTVLQDWWNNSDTPGALRRPYMGIDVDYIDPKQLRITGREVVFYGVGPRGGYLPAPYKVISPASGSRTYPFCRPNTIHGVVIAYAKTALGDLVLTENLEASTPQSYDPQQILVADASAQQFRGRIYEYRIMQVSEFLPAQYFPTLYVEAPFTAVDAPERTDLVYSVKNMGFPKGAPLVASSTTNDDTGLPVKITGRTREQRPGQHYEIVTEDITLNGTATVQTFYHWVQLYEITLDSAANGTVTFFAPASASFGSIRVIGIPADGDTLTIKHKIVGSGSWQTRTYTFKNTENTFLQTGTKATIAPATFYVRINHAEAAVLFWFDATGTTFTVPPAIVAATPVGGINVRVDISDVSVVTNADIYDLLIQAIDGVLLSTGAKAWTVLAGTATVGNAQIYDNFHGTRTAASLSGIATGWSCIRTTAGTAVAVKQLRIDYGSLLHVGEVPITSYSLNARNIYNTLADTDTALTAGQCSAGTTALPYVDSAEFAFAYDTITISDAENIDAVWDITPTGFALDVVLPHATGEDTTVAIFQRPPDVLVAKTSAYKPINFYNPDLTTANMPAAISVPSDDIALPKAQYLGIFPRSRAYIEAKAEGTPTVVITYEVSETGEVGTWVPGVNAPFHLQGGIVHRKEIVPAHESVNPNHIRIIVDNTASTVARAVHAALWINVED